MKVALKITMVFSLVMLLFTIHPAEAAWEVVDDFSSPDGCGVMLNVDECDFQFKYVDKQHHASDIDFELIFKVNHVMNTIHPSINEVYGQTFSADINSGHLSRLKNGGALTGAAYDQIMDLFNNSPKNPWDLKITHTHNSSISQLSLSYRYLNESGQIYSTTTTLSKENFTLEAQCQKKQPPKMTASASSAYSSSYGADKTVDGNDGTYWIGGRSEPSYTLDYDLGGTYAVDELVINWYSSTYAASDFDVLISEDGANYSEFQIALDTISSIELGGISVSHIRITIHAINNVYYPVIREVVIKGDWE